MIVDVAVCRGNCSKAVVEGSVVVIGAVLEEARPAAIESSK